MERYVRELRETSEKLRIAEAALHKKMTGLSRLWSLLNLNQLPEPFRANAANLFQNRGLSTLNYDWSSSVLSVVLL